MCEMYAEVIQKTQFLTNYKLQGGYSFLYVVVCYFSILTCIYFYGLSCNVRIYIYITLFLKKIIINIIKPLISPYKTLQNLITPPQNMSINVVIPYNSITKMGQKRVLLAVIKIKKLLTQKKESYEVVKMEMFL